MDQEKHLSVDDVAERKWKIPESAVIAHLTSGKSSSLADELRNGLDEVDENFDAARNWAAGEKSHPISFAGSREVIENQQKNRDAHKRALDKEAANEKPE